jgi:hypothetical protein
MVLQLTKNDKECKLSRITIYGNKKTSNFGLLFRKEVQKSILTIKLQNQKSWTIQLSKLFKSDHEAVLMGGFKFFSYNLVFRS